jgi:hypothetical protein
MNGFFLKKPKTIISESQYKKRIFNTPAYLLLASILSTVLFPMPHPPQLPHPFGCLKGSIKSRNTTNALKKAITMATQSCQLPICYPHPRNIPN